ncbi:hypothetical protein ACTHGU_18160 [Chitinophagaceae bacterium MMS25-I14]
MNKKKFWPSIAIVALVLTTMFSSCIVAGPEYGRHYHHHHYHDGYHDWRH